MQTVQLTTEDLVDILATYTATMQQIAAVAAAPGWYVVGAFNMPADFDVVLAMIGCVSSAPLVMTARLYDLSSTPPSAPNGTVQTSSKVDARVSSAIFSLIANHQYQMQVQVVGAAGNTYFGSLKSLGLFAP